MQDDNQTPTQPQTPTQEVGPLQTPQPPQSIKNDAPTGASPIVSQPPTPEAPTTHQPPVEPGKPKSNKILLFGVALLLIAVIGAAAYLFSQSQNSQTQKPISYEECISAEGSVIQESYPATCVTKDGERFVQPLSEEEQDKLKPSTPTPTEQPSDELTYEQDLTLDWKTYTNQSWGISIKYPPTWTELTQVGESYISSNSDNKIQFTLNKGIWYENMPLDPYSSVFSVKIGEEVGQSKDNIKMSDFSVNNHSATMFAKDYTNSTQEPPSYTYAYVIRSGSSLYILEFLSQDGINSKTNITGQRKLFDQILNTFEFIE